MCAITTAQLDVFTAENRAYIMSKSIQNEDGTYNFADFIDSSYATKTVRAPRKKRRSLKKRDSTAGRRSRSRSRSRKRSGSKGRRNNAMNSLRQFQKRNE